jgi:hypothetical protein
MKHGLLISLHVTGGVYHEACYCPMNSLSSWMETMQCPNNYEQIDRDLSAFTTVDMKKVRKEAVSRFSNRGAHSLCHYVVKDNKVD